MKQVVGGDGVLHDAEVGGTLKKVLALSAGVLGANLLAIDALYRETLYLPSAFQRSFLIPPRVLPCLPPWRGTRQTPRVRHLKEGRGDWSRRSSVWRTTSGWSVVPAGRPRRRRVRLWERWWAARHGLACSAAESASGWHGD